MWRAIEPRHDSGGVGDTFEPSPGVVFQDPPQPLATRLVAEAVERDLVSRVCDLAHHARVARDLFADDEEHRLRLRTIERGEHCGRALRVRTVVEREEDAAPARKRSRNPERRREQRNMRSESR